MQPTHSCTLMHAIFLTSLFAVHNPQLLAIHLGQYHCHDLSVNDRQVSYSCWWKRMEFGPHRRCGKRICVAYTRSVRPNLVVVPRMYSVCIWWQLTTTHIMIAQCDFKSQIRVPILFGRKKNQKYGHQHRWKRRGSRACILCRLCSFQPEDSVLAIASWMIL